MPISLLGATALSAGLNFLGNMFSNQESAKYNAQEAQKNRDFQERMYNQQVQDNWNFWLKQQNFNLPSAQLQRIKDSGLNPLLMYGQGGVSNVASSPAAGGTAPSGSQASSHFNNPIEFANLALLRAQIENINADTQQKQSTSRGLNIQNDINEATKDIQIAMKYNDNDLLVSSIRKLEQDVYNSVEITTQEVLTMMQAREYQIKQYQLNEFQVTESLKQGWADVENGRVSASAAFKNACAAWKNAVTAANLAPAQIANLRAAAGKLAFEVQRGQKLLPHEVRALGYENVGKLVTMLSNMAGISKAQSETLVNNMKALRMSLGNDTGIGSVLAPFTMPIGMPKHGEVVRDLYRSTGN